MNKIVLTFAMVVAFLVTAKSQNVYSDSVYVYTISTEKVKKCNFVYVDSKIVEFRISDNTVKTFFKYGEDVWGTLNKKIVNRSEKDGWVIFHDDKKVFMYKPTKSM